MKKCLVIIPTYNEASNIGPLIESIMAMAKKLDGWRLEVLVADDNSPDKTGALVKGLQKKYKNIRMISGPKAGHGIAYRRAMSHGLANGSYDAFVLMDADLSHDPGTVPILLAALDDGHDYVIGSRYVPGGRIVGWSAHRKLNSYIANLLARLLLDMKDGVRDHTGGFKAIRVSAFNDIRVDELRASGYVFHVNLLHEFSRRGYKIHEVPITFTERQRGSSKMRMQDVLEFIYLTYRLNPQSRVRRIIRFGLVGASGTLVNLAVLTGLVNLTGLSVFICDALAIETSIVSNFLLNHYYTFGAAYTAPRPEHKEPLSSLLKKLLKYNLIGLGGGGISFAAFSGAYKLLGLHYILSDLLAIILAMGWNYWMSVRVVWKVVDEV